MHKKTIRGRKIKCVYQYGLKSESNREKRKPFAVAILERRTT